MGWPNDGGIPAVLFRELKRRIAARALLYGHWSPESRGEWTMGSEFFPNSERKLHETSPLVSVSVPGSHESMSR